MSCNFARIISTFGIFRFFSSLGRSWLPFNVKMSHFDDQLADDSGKAVFTLGSITLPDKKIKSNNYQFCVCRAFGKHFGLYFAVTS